MEFNLVDKLSRYVSLSSIVDGINKNKIISVKDIDFIEEEIKRENPNDLDNVLYGIMLDILKYNNKHLGLDQNEDTVILKVETEKKNITWTDILSYLGIDSNLIDLNLKNEMDKITNLKLVEETARFIKNSRKAENRIINKITDINLVICILLYSSKKHISNIISYFKDENEVDGRALGKAIEAIPSIFLVDAPDQIPSNYNLFIKNYEILKNEGINVRNIIINKPIMMISSNLETVINTIKEVF